jgi:hypothetical protein
MPHAAGEAVGGPHQHDIEFAPVGHQLSST